MEIKSKLYKFYKWEHFWLVVIVLATFIMHLCLISQPSQFFFDEIYYVNDARHIISDNETWRPEHPPLGKLLIVTGELVFSGFKSPQRDTGTTLQKSINPNQTIITVSNASVFNVKTTISIDSEIMLVLSINPEVNQISVQRGYGCNAISHDAQQPISVFDDNPWGWRFVPILFGTATIVMFYFLCLRLGMSKNATIFATYLFGFENMTFVQNGMAMLDVFFLAFMMAAYLLYACRRYVSSGVAVGLAGLAKLNGLLALPTIAFHWIFTRKGRSWWALLGIASAVATYLLLMIFCDWIITRDFSLVSDPIHRIQEMSNITSSLTFHGYPNSGATYPWTWLYQYKAPLYYGMPHYYGAVSFSIWALIIPVFIYMIWRAFKKDNAALFGVGWFTCIYIVWIPATLITDRLTYPFYFYPAIGAICLGLGIALNQLWEYWRNGTNKKLRITALTAFIIIIVAHALSFLILAPIVPVDWANLVGLY